MHTKNFLSQDTLFRIKSNLFSYLLICFGAVFLFIQFRYLSILLLFIGLDFFKAYVKSFYKIDITIGFITIGVVLLARSSPVIYPILLSFTPLIIRLLLGKFEMHHLLEIPIYLLIIVLTPLFNLSFIYLVIIMQIFKHSLQYLINLVLFQNLDTGKLALDVMITIGNILFLSVFGNFLVALAY